MARGQDLAKCLIVAFGEGRLTWCGRVWGGELLQLSPKQRVDMVGNDYKMTRQRVEDLRFPFTRSYEPKSHLNSA